MKTMEAGTQRRGNLWLALSALVLLAAGWLLFTSSLSPHELWLGAGSVALSMLFLWVAYHGEPQHFDLRWSDALSLWRTPWYVLSSLGEIVYVLFRDLFGIERTPSFYRVCGFRTSKSDPLLVTRSALAIAYTSIAPNFIVIGIDYTRSRMLFHQIRRSEVPNMTRQLGAQITSDASRHPQPGEPTSR